MRWFINYGLRYRSPSPWHATVIGSMCHKVYETIADAKILARDGKKWKNDKIVGRIYADKYPIDKWKPLIFDHYSKGEGKNLEWDDEKWLEFCEKTDRGLNDEWSVMNIEPDRIVQSELLIDDLTVQESWGKEFIDSEGNLYPNAVFKGFIDLVFRDEDGQLIILDYKSGKAPKNWTTGRKKQYSDFFQDVQLNIYWHACKRYFKEEPLARLWYFAIPKPLKWEFPLDDSYFAKVSEEIGKNYEKIKTMTSPMRACDMDKGKWSCLRMKCPFALQTMGDFGHKDKEVSHDPMRDTFSPIDGKACVCDTIKYFSQFRTLSTIQKNCEKKRK